MLLSKLSPPQDEEIVSPKPRHQNFLLFLSFLSVSDSFSHSVFYSLSENHYILMEGTNNLYILFAAF